MATTETYPHVVGAQVWEDGEKLMGELKGRSPHTYRHSKRLETLALRMGCELPDIPGPIIMKLGFSARLHDIGKLHPSILPLVEARRRLTRPEKQKVVRVHTRQGGDMINALSVDKYEDLFATAEYVARYHHRKAFPGGRRSENGQIAVLLKTADIFEAAQAIDRPYRDGPLAASPEEAAEVVQQQMEVQPFLDFSPETVMEALIKVAQR